MPSRDEVEAVLREVFDPELGMSIVDLGLIYRIEVKGGGIEVDVTFTYPGCPAEGLIREEMAEILRRDFGLEPKIATVWTPVWGPERMSEEARISLGYPI
jgi:metal-sulfur cluster biosynthetic enzyme